MSKPAGDTIVGPDWTSGPDGAEIAVPIGDLELESGERLEDVTVTFQRWGAPDADRSNIVLALHALTGNSHVTGPPQGRFTMAGWWDGLIGPGCAVDTDEWCVVAPNAVGGCYGSTGPGSTAPDGRPWGGRFPRLTVRDLVEAERRAFEAIGVTRFAAVAGGSMGGARALEWLVSHPDRI
ncbi:MAG: alpha/beta fold hydrolase, partial [Gordonia sp. (in: high G+C Gram-positive bacteria)]